MHTEPEAATFHAEEPVATVYEAISEAVRDDQATVAYAAVTPQASPAPTTIMGNTTDSEWVGFDAAAAHLAPRGYGFQANAEDGLIHWIASGTRANYDSYVEWATDAPRAAAYAYLSEKVPAHLRDAMASLVCRVNWTMVWGNLDFDLDAGRLRVRKAVADAANLADVDAACDAALAEIERLHPLVMSVIYGGLSLDEALARLQTNGA